MLERIITGGQTGADQAGWRAAKRFGISTGGWMTKGFLTEDGPRPKFAALYGAKEVLAAGVFDYPVRTEANIKDCHAVLWFGSPHTPGGKLTLRLAIAATKDFDCIITGKEETPAKCAEWISGTALVLPKETTLMVAGNRESKAPGIGAKAEAFLADVFRAMGFVEAAEMKKLP